MKRIFALCLLMLALLLCASAAFGEETPTRADMAVITDRTLTLHEGEQYRLTYKALGGNLPFVFFSRNEKIASVDSETGLVTAHRQGSTTILLEEVSTSGYKTVVCSCPVTVVEDENSLVVHPAGPVVLNVGESQQFTVTNKAGTPVDVTFHGGSDDTVGTLTEEGLATCLSPAAISAQTFYAEDAAGRQVDFQVIFVNRPTALESIVVSNTAPWSAHVTVSPVCVNGKSWPEGTFRFSSSDESILSFPDPLRNKCTLYKGGKVKITATATYDESLTLTQEIHIPEDDKLYFNVDDTYLALHSLALYPGQEYALRVYSTKEGREVPAKLSSWNSNIVSVTKDGVVKAEGWIVRNGDDYTSSEITATYGGLSAVIEVKVSDRNPISNFWLTPETGGREVGVGESVLLKPSHGFSTSVYPYTWESLTPDLASVDDQGLVTMKAAGKATIKCNYFTGISATYDFYIGDRLPETVTLPIKEITLGVGESFDLADYPPSFDEGTVARYVYRSSDKKIASVSGAVITGKGVGETTVTVTTENDKTDDIRVTVKKAPTSLSVTTYSLRIPVGGIGYVGVSLGAEDETSTIRIVNDMGRDVVSWTWVEDGVLAFVGLKEGEQVVSIRTFNGRKQNVHIYVYPGPKGMAFKPNTLRVPVGGEVQPKVFFKGEEVPYFLESSDPEILEVDEEDLITVRGLKPGKVTLTASTLAGKTAKCAVTVFQPVQTIDLTGTPEILQVNKTLTLSPMVLPEDAENKKVTYASSNKKIATVTAKGVVKGIKPGKVTITITAADGSGTVSTLDLEVIPPVKVSVIDLTGTPETLRVGKTLTLAPVVLPVDAANKKVKYTSSNKKIATVSEKGVVKGIKPGIVTITVKAADSSGVSSSIDLEILPPVKVETIDLSGNPETLSVGKKLTLVKTVLPEDAANRKVKYTSSNKKIATVSTKGVVKGVKAGKVTITVKAADGSGVSSSIDLEILPPVKVETIDLSGNPETLSVGKKLTLVKTVLPEDAANKKVKYISSNKKIATVSEKGVVKGLKAGTVTITVKAADGSGVTAVWEITVVSGKATPQPETPEPEAQEPEPSEEESSDNPEAA